MSGGSMNYIYSKIEYECVGYMGDRELDDLMKDVAKLVHDREWCMSGDICEETYREAVQEFKQKWFNAPRKERLTEYIAEVFSKARDECLSMIGAYCDISVDNYGEYVDKSTAARLLGVSRATVYAMIADGRLQTGYAGKKVSVQSINDYMTKRG